MKPESLWRKVRAEEKTCRQIWAFCWESLTSLLCLGVWGGGPASSFLYMALKHGFLISLLHLSLLRPFINAMKSKVHLWSVHRDICPESQNDDAFYFQWPEFLGFFQALGTVLSILQTVAQWLFCTWARLWTSAGWKGCSALGSAEITGRERPTEEYMVPQNREASLMLPRALLKHHSISLSRGSITLGSEGPGFVFLLSFPFLLSLPADNSYLLSV